MNGSRIFVDTNKDISISFITELELLSFPRLSDKDEKTVKALLKNFTILDINPEIKRLTIELRKKSNLKLTDSIIAATAYINKLPLLTADNQFKTLDELDIIIYDI